MDLNKPGLGSLDDLCMIVTGLATKIFRGINPHSPGLPSLELLLLLR